VIYSGEAPKGKPKIHAKSVSLIVSIGTSDRNRTHEKFVEEILKRLKPVPRGEEGLHVSITGGHYILDGKVCLPDDYDPKTQNFKAGAVPPVWAGGPRKSRVMSTQQQMEEDKVALSSDAFDRKYSIGKYAPKKTQSKIITPAEQKARLEQWRLDKQRKADAEIEDFEWDESDVLDDKKLSKTADKSASDAVKKLKGTKKRVVKKPASKPTKKVVRRKK
jgi:hypothetical protein